MNVGTQRPESQEGSVPHPTPRLPAWCRNSWLGPKQGKNRRCVSSPRVITDP